MSYKKKKLKKSKFNQLKYGLGLVKIALLKRMPSWSIGVKRKEKPMFQMDKAIEALKRYDRLPNNPDFSRIEKTISDQLQKDGLLRLCVFVCPKFNPKALLSTMPENYMPVEAGPDLFEPRIQKIQSLRNDLMKARLPTEIDLIIGDNDAEEYIFPFMESLVLNKDLYRQRRSAYQVSFEQRCQKLFGGNAGLVIWSLAECSVSLDKTEAIISENAIQKELSFFRWLFSNDGPYRGMLNFSEEILIKMVRMKYALYGAQGKFLEVLGGILLQTEGPGVWLERTSMLKSTGSQAIPAIYPWIRKGEKMS